MHILRYIAMALALLALISRPTFGSLCFEIDQSGCRDMVQPAHVIVVLGALVVPDGQPGPNLTMRSQHSVVF